MPKLKFGPGADTTRTPPEYIDWLDVKAWRVHDGDPGNACLLVYADTRNRARWLGMMSSPAHDWLDDYPSVCADRQPEFDHIFDIEKVIMTNEELPEGTSYFYHDF